MYGFEAIKAYIRTPHVVSQVKLSGKMILSLKDFPSDHLKDLLLVEDPNFYSHNGVDIITPGAGFTTITQGLVKRYFFEDFSPGFLKHKKLKQTIIAWSFNQRVDKDTQLEMFVNFVYLGSYNGKDIIGFEQAAQTYFNKEFLELVEDEYLSILAMIVAPNGFNVLLAPEKNKERVERIKRLLGGKCKAINTKDVYYRACIS